MKTQFILIAVAILGVLFACLLPSLLKHDKTKLLTVQLKKRRFRVRPFTWLERLMLPFTAALAVLCARWDRAWGDGRLALANTILTMPGPSDTKLVDEAVGRYKLVKLGTDVNHIALCDATDIPLGFTRDASAAAAEDRVAFDLLGLSHKTTQGTASGAVTAGNLVCPGANGVLRDITLLSGTTVYVCGLALTTAANGETFVFVPYAPVQRVIA